MTPHPLFNGILTIDNAQEVASLVEKVLKGKKFTLISSNSGIDGGRPEESPGRTLSYDTRTGMAVYAEQTSPDRVTFRVWDERGAWGLCSTEARNGAPVDYTYSTPFVVVTDEGVKITFRTHTEDLAIHEAKVEEEPKYNEDSEYWSYSGSYTLKLTADAKRDFLPLGMKISGDLVSVKSGSVAQMVGGIEFTSNGSPFKWGYKNLVDIRDGEGKLLWKNRDYA